MTLGDGGAPSRDGPCSALTGVLQPAAQQNERAFTHSLHMIQMHPDTRLDSLQVVFSYKSGSTVHRLACTFRRRPVVVRWRGTVPCLLQK